jgi:RHS repeat-associated protein
VDGQAYTWDANGNLLGDGTRSFIYDAANRLTLVSSGTLTTTFEYDGLSNRVAQTVDGVETRYALDVAGGLPEVIAATTSGATTHYVQVQGQVLAQQEAGAWAYILPDHLGSARQLADAEGQISLAQSYDPFGNQLEVAGLVESGFGYTGEQADASTGLIFLRARHYDPGTGRFLTRDPFGGWQTLPYSLHPYQYGYSNPLLYVDPTGLCIKEENKLAGCPDWISDAVFDTLDWIMGATAPPVYAPASEGQPGNIDDLIQQAEEEEVGAAIPWMSLVVDLSPGYGDAKGFIETFTGQDLITEEELGNWKWLGLLGLSEARYLKHLDEVANACHDLAKLKLIGKAFEAAASAQLLARSGAAVNRAGQPLPRMVQVVSGKYDPRGWGIDHFALDEHGKLWILEFKGGKVPKLKETGFGYQMSTTWLQENIGQALGDSIIRTELEVMTGLEGKELRNALEQANRALIVPEGTKKVKKVTKTSLNRDTDIYYLLENQP